MTNFPEQLDLFQNPGSATTMDAPGFEHDVQHANLNDAVAALQAKLGITGSGDVNSVDYKVSAMVALLMAANPSVKLVVSGGSVELAIWDNVLEQYYPLTLNDGALGVGAVIT